MLEKEFTFYTLNNIDFYEIISIIAKEFATQQDRRIKYSDRIEMRYTDEKYDKAKITFKVNHGDILWHQNFKERMSGQFDRIQLYQEKITDWQELQRLNPEIIIGDKLQAFYYKERFEIKLIYKSEKIVVVGQRIEFFNYSFETIKTRNYIEVEGNVIDRELDFKIQELLKRWNFEKLDLENAKITLGNEALSGVNPFVEDIDIIGQLIWRLFKKKAIEKFTS